MSENEVEKLGQLLGELHWSQQETVKVFKAPPKDALGPIAMLFKLRLGARLLKFLAPPVAKRKGHRQHPEEFFHPLFFGEVGFFKLVAPLFQMTEKSRDSPFCQ